MEQLNKDFEEWLRSQNGHLSFDRFYPDRYHNNFVESLWLAAKWGNQQSLTICLPKPASALDFIMPVPVYPESQIIEILKNHNVKLNLVNHKPE